MTELPTRADDDTLPEAGFQLGAADWERLHGLRARFLEGGGAVRADYWRDERDLELYDAVYAARIGWKWDALLAELAWRGWSPPSGRVLDWGCGSGIAGRRFGAHFGWDGRSLALHDRAPGAAAFARERGRRRSPGLAIDVLDEAASLDAAPQLLLLSHVLGELSGEAEQRLLALAARATAVLWLEPGDRRSSRRLSHVRERLRAGHRVIAPCPHQATCGLLAPDQERHWCHFFALPPSGAYTSRFWRAVADELHLDMRALPYSMLAVDNRPSALGATPEAGFARVLGRPRIEKGAARLDVCRENGVEDLRFLQRIDRPTYKRLAEPAGERFLWRVEAEAGRIRAFEPWRANAVE
jgi:SAM-dependent methyltransferase